MWPLVSRECEMSVLYNFFMLLSLKVVEISLPLLIIVPVCKRLFYNNCTFETNFSTHAGSMRAVFRLIDLWHRLLTIHYSFWDANHICYCATYFKMNKYDCGLSVGWVCLITIIGWLFLRSGRYLMFRWGILIESGTFVQIKLIRPSLDDL